MTRTVHSAPTVVNLSTEGGEPYTALDLQHGPSRYACVIPVKNEGSRLHEQLRRMDCVQLRRAHGIDVIIADAPSTDGSTEAGVLADLGVSSVVVAEGEKGLSQALRVAFLHAVRQAYHGIIVMDGNNKDDPAALPEFIKAIEGGYDYVQGSRFAKDGSEMNTPLRRKLLIRCVHAPYYSLLCGRPLTDTTNGFRAFSARFLRSAELALSSNVMSKYELPYFMSWVACRRGFQTAEIGVSRHYPASGEVPTKIVGIKGYWQMLKPLLLLTLWTLRLSTQPQARQLEKARELQ